MSYTNDHEPQSPSEDLFGEVISSYTDAEALEFYEQIKGASPRQQLAFLMDSPRPALRARSDRRRSGPELIIGLRHHRPVPIFISVGEVSQTQSSRQDAHLVGPARQYPHVYRITDGRVHDVNILDEIGNQDHALAALVDGNRSMFRLVFAQPSTSSSSF